MPVTSSSFLSSQAAHHINTDFFTDLKIAGLTIHARFHIQYSAIKQTDTLPIYDRYGLGSENISMMMQLTAESWLLTCFTWIHHTVKQNKQITEPLIFFKHPFSTLSMKIPYFCKDDLENKMFYTGGKQRRQLFLVCCFSSSTSPTEQLFSTVVFWDNEERERENAMYALAPSPA